MIGYLASAVAGAILFEYGWQQISQSFSSHKWFWPAVLEGIGFYLVFRMIALSTQRSGITVTSIATKMSVVIPILIGILLLGESVSVLKISGLIFGTLAVVLAVGAGSRVSVSNWILPLLVFTSTGLIDASFKLFQIWGLTDEQFPGFIVIVFGFAFIASSIHHVTLAERWINRTSVISGIALGLANLGTVYFILKALAQPAWESSIVYPLNNFGIVLVSTVTAILVFGERLTTATKLSLAAVTLSIIMLYAAS